MARPLRSLLIASSLWAGAAQASQPDGIAMAEVSYAADLGPIRAVEPFSATPEMVTWAREATREAWTSLEKLDALQGALLGRDFEFTYDGDTTLTAAEAFDVRQGNCLTFTTLFVALARATGVDARLVSIERAHEFEEKGDLLVVTRHVVVGYRYQSRTHLIDFAATDDQPPMRWSFLEDAVGAAMIHTNRGVLDLRDGDLASALRHFEIATDLAPEWPDAWVDLGLARRRLGDLEGAHAAYARALEIDPAHAATLSNLAALYQFEGRDEEADVAMRAAADSRGSPWALIALADAEMSAGDLDAARSALRKARWRHPGSAEIHEARHRWARLAGKPGMARRAAARAEALDSR